MFKRAFHSNPVLAAQKQVSTGFWISKKKINQNKMYIFVVAYLKGCVEQIWAESVYTLW